MFENTKVNEEEAGDGPLKKPLLDLMCPHWCCELWSKKFTVLSKGEQDPVENGQRQGCGQHGQRADHRGRPRHRHRVARKDRLT